MFVCLRISKHLIFIFLEKGIYSNCIIFIVCHLNLWDSAAKQGYGQDKVTELLIISLQMVLVIFFLMKTRRSVCHTDKRGLSHAEWYTAPLCHWFVTKITHISDLVMWCSMHFPHPFSATILPLPNSIAVIFLVCRVRCTKRCPLLFESIIMMTRYNAHNRHWIGH